MKKIIIYVLVLTCLLSSLAVNVFASSDTVYSITEFDIEAHTVGGSNPSDYSSTVAFQGPSWYYDYHMTWVYNTDSNYYSSGQGKIAYMFHLTNFSLKDEYNLNFYYAINASIGYTFDVYITDKTSGKNLALIYSSENDSNFVAGNVKNCNVNFTLSDLGYTSNSNIYLMFNLTVPNHQVSYPFKFGFTDITLTNMDDDSGLLDSILNWLSRIYHSIAGGTDREGVNHTGIVQGITNALTNVKNGIVNKLSDVITGISNKLESVKNSIQNTINNIQNWFVSLGDRISDFFTMLKNYLLYFRHPVTINADGIPVDSSGNPVYTNPFESALNSVKSQFDEWINNINNFIDSIDDSANTVSTQLSTFKTIFNRFNTAIPFFGSLCLFIVIFFVIRKIIGR